MTDVLTGIPPADARSHETVVSENGRPVGPIKVSASATPVEIRRLTAAGSSTGDGLEITWSTGEKTSIDSALLRSSCPCATCEELRGKTSHAKPLGGRASRLKIVTATAEEGHDLRTVWPVGNYAIGIQWGDKHNSGIFPYQLLRKIVNGDTEW